MHLVISCRIIWWPIAATLAVISCRAVSTCSGLVSFSRAASGDRAGGELGSVAVRILSVALQGGGLGPPSQFGKVSGVFAGVVEFQDLDASGEG